MSAEPGADRWQEDPIRGLKTEDTKKWAARIAMLEHLKAVHTELGGESEDFVAKIDEALARIEGGVYDRCTSCHREIPEDIIRQSCPWHTVCSTCRRSDKG